MRPDKEDPATLRPLTRAVHAGNSVDPGIGGDPDSAGIRQLVRAAR